MTTAARVRHVLTVSYQVGPRQRISCPSRQEAHNELATIIQTSADDVAAWSIVPEGIDDGDTIRP